VTSTKPGVGVIGEDAQPEVLVGAVWDITELREAEEITRRDKATLEKLVKERSDELMDAYTKLADAKRLSEIGMLAATVAHELRNPLGVIQTAIYNISRKRKEPSLDRHLANIEKKMLESNQIIDNLLRYSRIRAPQYDDVRICDILDETISSAEKRFPGKKASVLRDFEAVKGKTIEADALQIKEVLANAFNNAYQALIDREGEIRVAARFDPGEMVVIEIKDDGAGIDRADLDRVFEPFFSKKSKGTGLGLTICRELVSLHGGTITIESEKGAGTTVTISLPRRRPER
jgi:signal transduction histidine kinase